MKCSFVQTKGKNNKIAASSQTDARRKSRPISGPGIPVLVNSSPTSNFVSSISSLFFCCTTAHSLLHNGRRKYLSASLLFLSLDFVIGSPELTRRASPDLQRYLPARLPLFHLTQWSHLSLDLPSNRGFSLQFRSIIRKNAVFLTTIFAGAFAFELYVTSHPTFAPPYTHIVRLALTKDSHNSSFDTFSNKVWDSWNAGVCHFTLLSKRFPGWPVSKESLLTHV